MVINLIGWRKAADSIVEVWIYWSMTRKMETDAYVGHDVCPLPIQLEVYVRSRKKE